MAPQTKRFLLDGIMLCSILIAFQVFLVGMAVPQSESKQYERVVEASKTWDAVYFSDSVNASVFDQDADPRTIQQFLSESLPHLKIFPIERAAYQMKVFDAYTHLIETLPHRPRFAIIAINLRSFSPYWSRSPLMQFEELATCLKWGPLLYQGGIRALTVFKAFDFNSISFPEYLNTEVFDGDKPLGHVRDFIPLHQKAALTAQEWHDWLAYVYCFNLTPKHPYVQAMRDMVKTLQAQGITPVCYITPLSVEAGIKGCGPEFKTRVNANIATIQKVLEDEHLHALDLSYDLKDEAFNYGVSINEHLKEAGRRHVAQQLAAYINSLNLIPASK